MKRDPITPTQNQIVIQPISHDVLAEKYLKPGETGIEDLFARVARALASVEKEEDRAKYEAIFLENLYAGAIGAGRIMSAAGTDIQATLINCFVQPVGDCIQGVDEDGYPGIYEALREAAETMRRGGGVGYDFSRIRPRGAAVKGTASMASGPCSYINVFDQSCSTVESAGARRGAQMGTMDIRHPDVIEFIQAKREDGRLRQFNLSLLITEEFVKAVKEDAPGFDIRGDAVAVTADAMEDVMVGMTVTRRKAGALPMKCNNDPNKKINVHTDLDQSDVLIARYAEGTGMRMWVRRIGGEGNQRVHDIATIKDGLETLVLGDFTGTLDADDCGSQMCKTQIVSDGAGPHLMCALDHRPAGHLDTEHERTLPARPPNREGRRGSGALSCLPHVALR